MVIELSSHLTQIIFLGTYFYFDLFFFVLQILIYCRASFSPSFKPITQYSDDIRYAVIGASEDQSVTSNKQCKYVLILVTVGLLLFLVYCDHFFYHDENFIKRHEDTSSFQEWTLLFTNVGIRLGHGYSWETKGTVEPEI